jgi:hypothetical protein
VSEQQQEQEETPQDETPAVTVQAGPATAAGSVTGPENED